MCVGWGTEEYAWKGMSGPLGPHDGNTPSRRWWHQAGGMGWRRPRWPWLGRLGVGEAILPGVETGSLHGRFWGLHRWCPWA